MTVIWFIFWLFKDTPEVYIWNNWAIGLGVCIVIDLLEIHKRQRRNHERQRLK